MRAQALWVACCLAIHLQPCSLAWGQEKPLDQSSPVDWPRLESNKGKISNDGQFVSYTIETVKSGTTLVVQTTGQSWKRELRGVSEGVFTEDSRWWLFSEPGQGVGILDLRRNALRYLTDATSFKIPKNGKGQWLAYSTAHPERGLSVLNLLTGEERLYANVDEYTFSDNGQVLLLQSTTPNIPSSSSTLTWLDLKSGTQAKVAQGYEITDVELDERGSQVAFQSKEQNHGSIERVIRYYRPGMISAEKLVDASTPGMEGVEVWGGISFSREADKLFFYCTPNPASQEATTLKSAVDVSQVNISRGEFGLNGVEDDLLLAVVHLHSQKKVIRLQGPGDQRAGVAGLDGRNDSNNLLLSVKSESNSESVWGGASSRDYYVESTLDGARRLLKKSLLVAPGESMSFSSAGKYVIWFDAKQKQWSTYNIARGSTQEIATEINEPLYPRNDLARPTTPFDIGGWLENDAAVLIYDQHDIWQVDPDGVKSPINLTHGYGAANNIRLRYLDPVRSPFGWSPEPIRRGQPLLLSAVDLANKRNGYFRLYLDEPGQLRPLIMEARNYYFHSEGSGSSDLPSYAVEPMRLIKARQADIYLVKRTSATEYPNVFTTTDFKNFRQLTTLAPQKAYNWYTTELLRWSLPEGGEAEGILYKPTNFDAKKRYPVIVHYYERSSDQVNSFLHAEWSRGDLNIPWFVSNGYLVFVPDIAYKVGHPGESAYNAVVSGAAYLSKQPFVDAQHLGLQGHSFGGFETDYIVTHSHLFAAACTAAGASDIVAEFDGGKNLSYDTRGQGRIGALLWERPDLYVENSAIFAVDRVTTPVLILHNSKDTNVSFEQGVEFFNGLATLRKKVWLLSYEGEGHVLEREENQRDFSIRMGQFFDHFLKGAPPPKWMIEKLARESTNVGLELELDTTVLRPSERN